MLILEDNMNGQPIFGTLSVLSQTVETNSDGVFGNFQWLATAQVSGNPNYVLIILSNSNPRNRSNRFFMVACCIINHWN